MATWDAPLEAAVIACPFVAIDSRCVLDKLHELRTLPMDVR